MNKFYITTPIYYASGEPHIGHAFTTIYADVVSRYQKLRGKEVFFAAGMDEHGSKIAERAQAENKNPQEFVDEISENYIKAWSALNIEYSDFIRTTSEKHEKGVYEFIKRIHDSGDIYEGFYEGLYCVDCEKFLSEKDLVNGCCPDHLKPPQKLKEKNYFFNLKKYLPVIREKIASDEIKIIPETRKNEILGIIDSGISDFSISREKVKWGIPFPYDKSQVIYVWVEALMNYLTILDFPKGEKYKKFWPADLHLIGADISKFHCIFWPGLLLSAGLPLPKNIFVHGFLTVDSQKMSKTIGNVIDPLEMVKNFGVDVTRYLILSQFPATEHGDIKATEFTEKYNSDLANGLGNLFERVLKMIVDYKIELNDKNLDKEIIKVAEETESQYHQNFANYNLFEALKTILGFTKTLDKYINEKEPWNLYKNKNPELAIVLNSLFFGLGRLVLLTKPFLPEKAEVAAAYLEKIKSKEISKEEKLNLFPRIQNKELKPF